MTFFSRKFPSDNYFNIESKYHQRNILIRDNLYEIFGEMKLRSDLRIQFKDASNRKSRNHDRNICKTTILVTVKRSN